MENLYARSVFFVNDGQRSLDYYTKTLGFSLDWDHEEGGRPWVFQVSLLGSRCRQLGCQAVVVLGHAEYYPRLGFSPAVKCAICCESDVRDDVFMAVELDAGALSGASGLVRHDEALADIGWSRYLT